MFKGKVLLFSLLLLFATSLYAGDVDECESEVWIAASFSVSICPQGDFDYLRDQAPDGVGIWAVIRDASGNGIAGIPWTDYWVQACDPLEELYLCTQPILSDSMTSGSAGVEGQTTFGGRIAGGGCSLTGGVYLACQGKTIKEKPACTLPICLAIKVKSPDLNVDGDVTLADLSFFGVSYNTSPGDPGYNECCDYNHNGPVTLSDFTFFGSHYRHNCGY